MSQLSWKLNTWNHGLLPILNGTSFCYSWIIFNDKLLNINIKKDTHYFSVEVVLFFFLAPVEHLTSTRVRASFNSLTWFTKATGLSNKDLQVLKSLLFFPPHSSIIPQMWWECDMTAAYLTKKPEVSQPSFDLQLFNPESSSEECHAS